jgi:hypothetical protein
MLQMFLWDLGRSQQGGVLEFGVNNIEGRIPWSQVYYLNGLMDALLLENLHRDGKAIFSQIEDALVDRITLEILSLDDLLDNHGPSHKFRQLIPLKLGSKRLQTALG